MITISSLFIKAANRFIKRMTIEQTGLYPPRYLTIHSAFDIEFKSWGNGRIRTRMSSLQVISRSILHSSHFIRRRELISPKISSNQGAPSLAKRLANVLRHHISRDDAPLKCRTRIGSMYVHVQYKEFGTKVSQEKD